MEAAGERGFTLIEIVVVIAITAGLLAAGAWAFSLHPNALAAATDDVDAALAEARTIAAAGGNGATIVFAPRQGNTRGFTLQVFEGRPDAPGAVTATSSMPVVSDASVIEKTLGTPPFSLFINSAGDASGSSSYPVFNAQGSPTFTEISQEPACPSGGYVLTFTNPQNTASVTRALPCSSAANGTPAPNPSPTPNVPIATPTALLFHWPADQQQAFVATEWGYTHWFASQSGFVCGSSVAVYPDVLPSPYTAAYSPSEAALAPSPPPNTPYSFPNSSGASMNDAPASFPLQPQNAGICSATVEDDYEQGAAVAVVTMGWLTATYGTTTVTHDSGAVTIPANALPKAGSSATISLAKTFDVTAVAPRVAFTGGTGATCAQDLTVNTSTGTTPGTPSSTPATASVTLTVNVLPPSSLSCTGIIYNHYTDSTAPSDAASQSGEGITFTTSLSPSTGPLTTLSEIAFPGTDCPYAQLYLQADVVDANAPNTTDGVNATDSNGCVTNSTVKLWATETGYSGNFTAIPGPCATDLTFSPNPWSAGSMAVVTAQAATAGCAFHVESSDQTVSNGEAKSVTAIVNSCSTEPMTIVLGTSCEITIPQSQGDPPDCTPGGSGGSDVTVATSYDPNPMLGTLTAVPGSTDEYYWTRTSPGTQTITVTVVQMSCKSLHRESSTYTID